MSVIIDFIFHMNTYLNSMVENYGYLIYFILFAVIFCETGLVVTPFLPGDSIIFACGTIAALGKMNLEVLAAVFISAAVLGNTVNYLLGRYFGLVMLKKLEGRFIKRKHIDEAHLFYEKYGGMAIFLTRFVPIVRTFAPFVAGISKMDYRKFTFYNIIGAIVWTALFLTVGYRFGNIPFIKQNFSTTILAVVLISFIPVFVKFLSGKAGKKE